MCWSFDIPTLGNMDGKDNRYSMNCMGYINGMTGIGSSMPGILAMTSINGINIMNGMTRMNTSTLWYCQYFQRK